MELPCNFGQRGFETDWLGGFRNGKDSALFYQTAENLVYVPYIVYLFPNEKTFIQ